MFIAGFVQDVSTWESIVGFCRELFSICQSTFNDSLLGDFLKSQVIMGKSITYGSLLFGALLIGVIGSKVRDAVIHLIIPSL